MNSLPRWIKRSLYILADLFSIIAIGLFVFFSRDFSINFQVIFLLSLFSYAFILIFIFVLTGVYSIITLHFGMIDAFKIGLITTAFNLFVYLFISSVFVDYSPIELAFVFVSEPAILIGLRVARRAVANIMGYSKSDKKNLQRTLIIGAGAAGKMVIDELRSNFNLKAQPIVVVDDDPKKLNRQFLNLPVLGPVKSISSIISRFKIQQVIIAIGNINRLRLFELLRIMEKEPVVIRRLPLMEELEKDGQHMKVKDVDVNELLGRDVIPLINDEI
jgi:FlaA1/EpsC-like NDP-sugar epimerase